MLILIFINWKIVSSAGNPAIKYEKNESFGVMLSCGLGSG